MEYKIGTRITLEVVESDNGTCIGCYFMGIACSILKRQERIGECDYTCRSDSKSIIYKEIKEEK